ncbi:glucosaminidase domain-containing protein [Vogesella indigofera]|uniref:glucosaminidase domain-containing protein n=1 Tax=Vogesella indigofera TaxID=45465 RepID=UPI003F424AC2
MLHPDFRINTPTITTPASGGIAPAADGGQFAAVFRDTRQEIVALIDQGFPAGDEALTPQGLLLRQRAQAAAAPLPLDGSHLDAQQQAFLGDILPHAQKAARALGVSPDIIAAHAALESGWGQAPLRRADGSSSHNLFGIKAGQGWRGERIAALTTEHQDGVDVKQVAPFRAYADYDGAFADYVSLLSSSPRFKAVQGVGSDAAAFAAVLARGGYATDPDYANKLQQTVSRLRGPA